LIEQMKIELSDKLHRLQSTLNDDCKNIVVSRPVAKGLYHPDLAFSLQLTGESLKSVILRAWKEHWGPALVGTLNDIKFRGGQVSIDTIEKVVLAGGSSHLAFIPQLVAKTLAGQVQFNPSDIVVGHHFQKAVAYGLAVEAREQRNTSLRSHDSIGPCIFSPLYFLVASERSSNLTAPSIRLAKSRVKRPDGALLDGPVQIANFTLDYEITLPFRPKKYFVYKFFDTPGADQNSEILPLNLEDDVVRVPANCPLTFSLSLHFGDDGVVRPHFDFGHDPIPARDFFFGGLQISREVESYAGIDFGTSNSYVVNLWSEPVARDIDYPTLTISESTGSHLRTLEEKIKQYQKMNLLNAETAKKLADDQRSRFIFNSIKIEGSPLTKGETEGAVSGSIPITTKELKEPVNVAQGYDFVRQNSSSYRETPEAFLRQLNKIVLDGISDDAGEYRVEAVKLSGMDFEPPPAVAVPPHMERLARELREGPGAKSTVHFAAEAHAKVTSIHPFADGNGRTARLLVNAILIDAGLCPVTIEFTEKERYLDCLKASNSKDLSLMCALISELIEESLDSLNPETIPEQNGVLPVVQAIVPPSASQRLAEAVRRKVAALTGQREARYGAWCGAFESFKQELSAASSLFNETYKLTSPFSIRVTMFDTLPLEKYDGIIQGAKTPKTWLTGCEINGDTKLEGFMFFFQAISYQFTDAARAEHVVLAPRDVSLAISRRTGGMYRRLLDEPVALREIAYADGQLVFLLAATSGKWQVSRSPISEVINNFFADSIEAFF
jgi:fido (protein-threonine AMPylation protein)